MSRFAKASTTKLNYYSSPTSAVVIKTERVQFHYFIFIFALPRKVCNIKRHSVQLLIERPRRTYVKRCFIFLFIIARPTRDPDSRPRGEQN